MVRIEVKVCWRIGGQVLPLNRPSRRKASQDTKVGDRVLDGGVVRKPIGKGCPRGRGEAESEVFAKGQMQGPGMAQTTDVAGLEADLGGRFCKQVRAGRC